MQNLHTCHSVRLPIHLPSTPHCPLLTTSPQPYLHLVHRSGASTLTLTSHPLPPSTDPVSHVSIHTPEPTSVTALLALPDSDHDILLALRSGLVYSISLNAQPSPKASILADVTDESNPSNSGVLAAALSPDGHVLALVSPVKLTLLDQSFNVLAEMPLPCTASHAALSWRTDGDFLVVVIRDIHNKLLQNGHFSHLGAVCALVTDRSCSTVQHLDIDPDLAGGLAVCVDWEPRVGGAIAIAGPGTAVTFFERNGQRLRRRDLKVVSNGTPKKLRWSSDCKWLAIACEEPEDQGEGDAWRVSLYQMMNYRWYCKRRLIVSHRVLDLVWDEDDAGIITIITERDILRLRVLSVPSTMINCQKYSIGAVVDGQYVLLTDFSKAVVPPPFSHATIPCQEDIVALAPARHGDGFVTLTANAVLEWFMFMPSGLSDPVTGTPPFVLSHPPQFNRCLQGCKVLRAVRDSDRGHELEDDAAVVIAGFRMPVMPSRNCVILVGAGGLWRDRESAEPGDALFMFLLSSNQTDSTNANDSSSIINSNSGKMSIVPHGFMPDASQGMLNTDDEDDVDTTEFNNESNIECEKSDAGTTWGEACRLLVDGHVTAVGHSSEEMSIIVVTSNGVVMRMVVDEYARRLVEVAQVTNVSTNVIKVHEVRTGRGRAVTILLDEDGQLDVVELASGRRLSVSRECTSFCVHEGFVIFTTRSHLLYCIVIDTKSTLFNPVNRESVPSIIDTLDSESHQSMPQLREGHGATRPIDRGSVIVTALHGKTDIILQAPRGNVETISPRPVVFEVVDRLAKASEYAKAFELCRRQRVDMNHVVDANFDAFIDNVAHFVKQVRNPGHLSVFMTFLNGDTEKINKVCKAIVQQLLLLTSTVPSSKIDPSSSPTSSSSTSTTTSSTPNRTDIANDSPQNDNKNADSNSESYSSAILTGLIRQQPSDMVGALNQIALVRNRNIDDARSAVDFLFVLVKDQKRVYEEVLGIYDLSLASFIAECSQMDPAEYSREIHDLRQIKTESERRYQINMKLERYDKALRHLFSCGPTRYNDCVELCHEHALYETGLQLFRRNDSIRVDLLGGYANHLRDIAGKHEAAASVFLQINNWKEAAECYRLANKWEMAVYAIGKCDSSVLPSDEKTELFTNMADHLADGGLVIPCARIRVSLLGDIDGALEVLASAGEWDAAFEAVNSFEMVASRQMDETENENVEREQGAMTEKVEQARQTLKRHILEECESLLSTLAENRSKLKERGMRLTTLLEVANKVRQSMTSSANTADPDNDNKHSEVESDVFSATSASSLGSHLSDVTFTNKTSTTSLYSSSVGPGVLSGAKLEKQALKRQHRMSKKRIREGHPNEREYLVGYLQKLIPTKFLRERVQRMVDALIVIQKFELATKVIQEMDALTKQALSLPPNLVLKEETKAELEGERQWDSMTNYLAILSISDETQPTPVAVGEPICVEVMPQPSQDALGGTNGQGQKRDVPTTGSAVAPVDAMYLEGDAELPSSHRPQNASRNDRNEENDVEMH